MTDAQLRAALFNVANLPVGVTGSLDAGDRQHVLLLYRFEDDGASPSTSTSELHQRKWVVGHRPARDRFRHWIDRYTPF